MQQGRQAIEVTVALKSRVCSQQTRSMGKQGVVFLCKPKDTELGMLRTYFVQVQSPEKLDDQYPQQEDGCTSLRGENRSGFLLCLCLTKALCRFTHLPHTSQLIPVLDVPSQLIISLRDVLRDTYIMTTHYYIICYDNIVYNLFIL